MEEKKRKTDRRTLYTKKLIMDAYVQLVKENPRDKIKITELCKLAGINRCTFYLHFQDIRSVENEIFNELQAKFGDFVQTQNNFAKNRKGVSDHFIEKLLHDDTYTTLLMTGAAYGFIPKFAAPYFQSMKNTLVNGNMMSEREKEILYTFIVGGSLAVQQNWILNQSDVRKENHFLDRIIQKLLG